jgi:hypothetical protein
MSIPNRSPGTTRPLQGQPSMIITPVAMPMIPDRSNSQPIRCQSQLLQHPARRECSGQSGSSARRQIQALGIYWSRRTYCSQRDVRWRTSLHLVTCGALRMVERKEHGAGNPPERNTGTGAQAVACWKMYGCRILIGWRRSATVCYSASRS